MILAADAAANGATIWVAAIGGVGAVITGIIAEMGRRQSKAANNAVNNVKNGEKPLKERVGTIETVLVDNQAHLRELHEKLDLAIDGMTEGFRLTDERHTGLSAQIELVAKTILTPRSANTAPIPVIPASPQVDEAAPPIGTPTEAQRREALHQMAIAFPAVVAES